MSIELRILSGARAGQTASFDKPVVVIGRHPTSDLQFDTHRDLDVSTTHGEIRDAGGRYTLYDQQSRNGTFVNRERLPAGGSRELRDGDVVAFGENGPTVAVHITSSVAAPPIIAAPVFAAAAPAAPPPVALPPITERRPTGERVALAVREQTRWLRVAVIASVLVLGGLAASVYYMGRRGTAARDEEIAMLVAANDRFATQLHGMNDTALTNSLRRSTDSLAQAVRDAKGGAAQSARALQQLHRNSEVQRKLTEVDMPAVRDANDAAIVLIASEVNGTTYEATGFSVNNAGLIVTNRHVVADSTGQATRLGVKFANTNRWMRAHVVKLSASSVDLAIIQLDDRGTYPAVRGIGGAVDTKVGSAILTLGFPEGTDLPMEGKGNDAIAKTSLFPGVISKSTSEVLQIDSYATHGSSGSPVFDAHGHVVGVVWGGPPDGSGAIVFAVPAAQIAGLVKSVK